MTSLERDHPHLFRLAVGSTVLLMLATLVGAVCGIFWGINNFGWWVGGPILVVGFFVVAYIIGAAND